MTYVDKFGVPLSSSNTGKESMLMPKRKHLWRARFIGLGSIGTDSKAVTAMLQTFDRPKINYNPVTVDSYNSKAYYAGKHEWQTVSCTVRDDITNTVSKVVSKQVQMQLNHYEQSSFQAAANYKFTTFFEILDGANNVPGEVLHEQWMLEGCFFENVEYDQGDYTSADPFMITMGIRYDNATQVLNHTSTNGISTMLAGQTSMSEPSGGDQLEGTYK